METVSRGYYPDGKGGFFADPLDGLVYTSLQELATRIAHRNTGQYTDDPLIVSLTGRIAIDENLHYVFYRELAKAALEIDPSAMMMAINRQVVGFQMPGLEYPRVQGEGDPDGEGRHLRLGLYHDQVVLPVLFKHWKIDQLTDLTEEAKEAREGVMNYLAMLDATATMYEEKRAAADLPDPPPPTEPRPGSRGNRSVV